MKKTNGYITSLSNGEKVGSKIRIDGYVENKLYEKDIWIVHRRIKGGQFWPKEPKVTIEKNNTFSLSTFEGGAPGMINISLNNYDGNYKAYGLQNKDTQIKMAFKRQEVKT